MENLQNFYNDSWQHWIHANISSFHFLESSEIKYAVNKWRKRLSYRLKQKIIMHFKSKIPSDVIVLSANLIFCSSLNFSLKWVAFPKQFPLNRRKASYQFRGKLQITQPTVGYFCLGSNINSSRIFLSLLFVAIFKYRVFNYGTVS